MDTCLFTGVELTPQTREEHTIPESLGGRIKSRYVTCDDFNNRCGSYVDSALKEAYVMLLQHLAPLLPRASHPGRTPITVPGEPDGLVVESGRVGRPGTVVYEKDERGRPKSVGAGEPSQLRKMARQLGKNPDQVIDHNVRATEATTFYTRVPLVHREVEIAALKSILLTFDHFLRKDQAARFTRWPEMEPVTDFVRDAIRSGCR